MRWFELDSVVLASILALQKGCFCLLNKSFVIMMMQAQPPRVSSVCQTWSCWPRSERTWPCFWSVGQSHQQLSGSCKIGPHRRFLCLLKDLALSKHVLSKKAGLSPTDKSEFFLNCFFNREFFLNALLIFSLNPACLSDGKQDSMYGFHGILSRATWARPFPAPPKQVRATRAS